MMWFSCSPNQYLGWNWKSEIYQWRSELQDVINKRGKSSLVSSILLPSLPINITYGAVENQQCLDVTPRDSDLIVLKFVAKYGI